MVEWKLVSACAGFAAVIGWIPRQLLAGGSGIDPTLDIGGWERHRYLFSGYVYQSTA